MLKYLTVFSKANSFGCPDITPFSLCESMCKWTKTEGNRMKTVIPSLYIRAIKKALERKNVPIREVFLKRQCSKKRNTLKIQNSWINTLKGHIYQFWQSIFGKKSYPYLAGLKQHIGLPFGKHSFRSNSSNQKIWYEAQIMTSRKKGILPFSGGSTSKASAATNGDQRT